MSTITGHDRQKRNEKLLRAMNTQAKTSIKKYFHYEEDVQATPIEFACECSDLNCDKRVRVSIADYETIHANKSHYIVVDGHQLTDIETVVNKVNGYLVVQKF
jgi:hypothetical protein